MYKELLARQRFLSAEIEKCRKIIDDIEEWLG